MTIREATIDDFDAIWPIFHDIVSSGTTYSFPRDTTKAEAIKIWLVLPVKTFIYKERGEVLGSYYIKTNQTGSGDHVCNCGYIVSVEARGKGVATSMCEHSQKIAVELGYKAMQFNFIVSTNVGAIRLWKKLGFQTVGCLPKAFNHPQAAYVDVFLMYKWLAT